MDSSKRPYRASTYTLRRLLDDEVTLVIPDMQRDYCWGTDRSAPGQQREKVGDFVSALVYLYGKGSRVTLGMLYGYEDPRGSRRIHIIDGQQRLTTLYLLVGMLYRRTPEPWLRRMLISDYKLIDDREPRLLYQVRTEALYFMSDMVANFFLNCDGRLSQIERSPWYFSSYDSDPTVQSFIGAVRSIDRVLEEAARDERWDFGAFARFVADELVFTYCDTGSRAEAERLFVTINTTGQPLSPTQGLKSLLYNVVPDREAFIRQWDEIEMWCWRHRSGARSADDTMDRFINIWRYYRRLITNRDDDHKALSPEIFGMVYEYFGAYAALVDEVPEVLDCSADRPDDMLLLLPSIAYIQRWGRGGRRIWAFLSNLLRYQHALSSGADALAAIEMVDGMTSPDLVTVLTLKDVSRRILNDEQRCGLQIVAENMQQRHEAERLVERARAHPLLGGRIMRLVHWCADPVTKTTDIAHLRHYVDAIYSIWGDDIDRRTDLDVVRRALLTLRHSGYPMPRRSATSLSLCWNAYDWQRLMSTYPGLVRQFIDRVAPHDGMDVQQRLYDMVNRYADPCHPYFFLIKKPDVMARSSHRSLMQPCLPFVGIHNRHDNNTSEWYVDQHPLTVDTQRWTPLRTYGSRCLYTDSREHNLAVDIYHTPEKRQNYRIEVFARPDGEEYDVAGAVEHLPVKMSYDRKRSRYFLATSSSHQVAELLGLITGARTQKKRKPGH